MSRPMGGSWTGPWAGPREAHEPAHGPAHDFETLNLSMDEGIHTYLSNTLKKRATSQHLLELKDHYKLVGQELFFPDSAQTPIFAAINLHSRVLKIF